MVARDVAMEGGDIYRGAVAGGDEISPAGFWGKHAAHTIAEVARAAQLFLPFCTSGACPRENAQNRRFEWANFLAALKFARRKKHMRPNTQNALIFSVPCEKRENGLPNTCPSCFIRDYLAKFKFCFVVLCLYGDFAKFTHSCTEIWKRNRGCRAIAIPYILEHPVATALQKTSLEKLQPFSCPILIYNLFELIYNGASIRVARSELT